MTGMSCIREVYPGQHPGPVKWFCTIPLLAHGSRHSWALVRSVFEGWREMRLLQRLSKVKRQLSGVPCWIARELVSLTGSYTMRGQWNRKQLWPTECDWPDNKEGRETGMQKWAKMLVKTSKAFVDPCAMMTQMKEDSEFWRLPPLTVLCLRTLYVNTKHREDGPDIANMDSTTTRLITF